MISLVLDATNGILAITSPAVIFCPFTRFTKPPAGRGYTAGCLNSPTSTGLPLESTISIVGLMSLPADVLSATSMISTLDKPVNSSSCSLTVTPSSISENFTLPAVSEIIGLVYGSHEAIFTPSSKLVEFATSKIAPYGTLYCSIIFPFESAIEHIAFLETTTSNLSLLVTDFMSSENITIPEFLLKIEFSSDELEAAPPI